MVVLRFANLLVVIFRENDRKSDIFDTEDLFFFVNLKKKYFHLIQRKKLPKKLSLEEFRVFSNIFGIYDGIPKHVPKERPRTRDFQ